MDREEKHLKKVILPVTGMTCASCAATVEKGLSKLPGVSLANVNVASEKASVEYDGTRLDTGKLIDTVNELGYGVTVDRNPMPARRPSKASLMSSSA